MNPLLEQWQTPHQLPPFAAIRTEHFLPAFAQAFQQQLAEIEAIEQHVDAASFANTIEALEASGQLLNQVAGVFFMLTSAHSDAAMRAVQAQITPQYAAHESNIFARSQLFHRVDTIMQQQAAGAFTGEQLLTGEQLQLLQETHKRFIRAGARLETSARHEVAALDQQLATLQTRFSQNILNDTNRYELLLETPADLEGLPISVRRIAAQQASSRGHDGKYLFTLSRSSMTPFLQFSARRELREQLWRAYTRSANNDNEFDNKTTTIEIAQLRARRAQLLGFATHADYVLDDRMAASPSAVRNLLDQIWAPAREQVQREALDLQARRQQGGENQPLAPWDWWYFTEKLRNERFDLDSETLKPYFQLERVRDGAFAVAQRLFGITFTPAAGTPGYHEDVDAFEVREADGQLIGVFCTDYYMRPSKRSGAWMTALRKQATFDGDQYPVVFNTCNFARGTPTLLSLDEVRTVFHEFGHALHGLLSKVHYRSLSGTAVKRDFVELPSQIMENWAMQTQVLEDYARHHETGATIPPALIQKIQQSSTFNQGFITTEYLAAAYLDLAWHGPLPDAGQLASEKLEADTMQAMGLPAEIAPRYRSTYFQHIFSGAYSAGYYSYIWAEVLDADAFALFREKGIFDQETASALRTHILEQGGAVAPMELYRRFRGRDPQVRPLLESRGLMPAAPMGLSG